MKCSQVEKLLPLYAGHDLAERREQLVTLHLQSCADCSLAAAEYRAARQLIHDFAAPGFDDQVYAEMRKNVWRQIEQRPRRRSLFASVAGLFEPQWAWAAAAVLMIAVAIVSVYFTNQFVVRPAVIVDIPKIVVPAMGAAPGTHGAPFIPKEVPQKRQANLAKRQPKPDRMVAPDRGNSFVAYSPDAEAATGQSAAPVSGTDNPGSAAPGAEKTLRMEIQTQNPNIRIIWFSQREPKPLTTPSKGI